MIGSDQAARPEGLDDVRAYGVLCCAPPFNPPWFGVLRELRCSRWASTLQNLSACTLQTTHQGLSTRAAQVLQFCDTTYYCSLHDSLGH